jgi:DNA-binding MarR family transcriptional regulator
MTGTPAASLVRFERSLAEVLRLLADRETIGDIAERSGHDLPPASWSLLEHLEARGSLRVSEIAACHGVDISSVTPRLKTLENAGLITRERSTTDARVFMITITPRGSHALESVHAVRREILAHIITEADANQISAATEILSRIAARLSMTDDRLGHHATNRLSVTPSN